MICRQCNEDKEIKYFLPHDKGLCTFCKVKNKKGAKKARHKVSRRRSQFKFNYNLTLEEYNDQFDEQKGCCKICGKHQSELTCALAVDHNHTTGLIRGLLCLNCNTGLGHFRDSEDLLLNAIKYLKEYN